MKKLCLTLLIAASLAGAAPHGSFAAHYRMPGLWTRRTPPDPIMPVWNWFPFHRFFMMW